MSKLHQIALTCIPGVGHVTARSLLSYCGSAEEVFEAKQTHLKAIPGIGPKKALDLILSSTFPDLVMGRKPEVSLMEAALPSSGITKMATSSGCNVSEIPEGQARES